MAFQCDAFARDAFQNDCPGAGWRPPSRGPGHWPREESDEAREARIKADRIRMGILPPEIKHPSSKEALERSRDKSESVGATGLSDQVSLASYLLPEDLAGLEALAARAAELTMDAEIALWMRLAEQRRLHEAWLRDEDDAAVLMLAIATLH